MVIDFLRELHNGPSSEFKFIEPVTIIGNFEKVNSIEIRFAPDFLDKNTFLQWLDHKLNIWIQNLWNYKFRTQTSPTGGVFIIGRKVKMSQKELQPHEQRVVEEKEQLGERLVKLREFLEKGQPSFIDDKSWGLLKSQFEAMSQYFTILLARIEQF